MIPNSLCPVFRQTNFSYRQRYVWLSTASRRRLSSSTNWWVFNVDGQLFILSCIVLATSDDARIATSGQVGRTLSLKFICWNEVSRTATTTVTSSTVIHETCQGTTMEQQDNQTFSFLILDSSPQISFKSTVKGERVDRSPSSILRQKFPTRKDCPR